MKNTNLFVNVSVESNQSFLIFNKYNSILSESDIAKTNIKILSKQFDVFYFCYIFNAFDKINNVTKINVFVNIFNKIINNRRFVIIHKIKKINFVDVLTIVNIVVIFKRN